ncbi:MAG: hypothetical protein JNM76_12090 [Betaproteobacteria bacterium]|nr:hypothetical protein [Betaproteobacteria bacterium]
MPVSWPAMLPSAAPALGPTKGVVTACTTADTTATMICPTTPQPLSLTGGGGSPGVLSPCISVGS